MTTESGFWPVALIILDGWGCAPPGPGNAVELAHTPTFDALWRSHPHSTLKTSGRHVGLPEGQVGNSEVGHLNLGAGRIVFQDLARIDNAIADGTFAVNPELLHALTQARDGTGIVHVLALLSYGGVHSHLRHVEALVRAAVAAGVPRVAVHAFTDGRDTAPTASLTDIQTFATFLKGVGDDHSDARIATVMGRYWAMDRDGRWDRTERAWRALAGGEGVHVTDPLVAVAQSHAAGVTDEFVEPHIVHDQDEPWLIGDRDVVIFANFRADRARQLSSALARDEFSGFIRVPRVRPHLLTMTRYEDDLAVPVLFDSSNVSATIADVLAAQGIAQLHIAETEKYAHVTYFFNGGVESAHAGEERVLVSSPRDVPTYDLKPHMSAAEVTDRFCAEIDDRDVGFAVLNYANPDMVGHTGVIPAAVTAVESVDAGLGRVVDAVHARGGVCIVTSDHGNAEQMLTEAGTPHTSHTSNPVPLVVTLPPDAHRPLRHDGVLADVAPTVLDLLGIPQPADMTGRSLLGAAH